MPSEGGVEVFSNPLAPPSLSSHHGGHQGSSLPALTNEDFRKLLMTPRSGAPSVAPPSAKSSSHTLKSVPVNIQSHRSSRSKTADCTDWPTLAQSLHWSRNTAAERRRQAIQESKFLGGDMEHTHLVKGLDFALLQKVRSEIAEDEEEDEELNVKKMLSNRVFVFHLVNKSHCSLVCLNREEDDEGDEVEFTTKLGQKVYKALFRSRPADRNELFQPGRMAYVFDVEDEYAESDIPTTLIRSKADCPGIEVNPSHLTTNDIVINKLTQILLYLRQGTRTGKKIKKKDKGKEKERNDKQAGQKVRGAGADDSIFGDVGDYDPTETTKEYGKKSRTKEKEREKERKKSRSSSSYFNKSADGEDDPIQFDKKDVSAEEFAKSVAQTFGKKHEMEERAAWDSVEPKHRKRDRSSRKVKDVDYVPDSYSECYPGAAFQFGIKMSEGRKTRRAGPKDEKAKLDRDWQKISKMLSKRKEEGKGERGESESKRRKH
ncbi:PREDICTED: protein Red-like [Acropora digitifera]|uniref:protein Red-like n=1 Tax=Acropora digitifera TaxID=70779 RepID=UPI00077A53BA|nr:PREDICTED: protein Red-like [Acropora digitifera]